MKRNTLKRVMSSALAGALMMTAAPFSAFAAGSLNANVPQLVENKDGTITLNADSNLNGEQKVTVKNYMTENKYVTDGLVLMLDGINNAGENTHDTNSDSWVNLADNSKVEINRTENRFESEGTNYFTDNAFVLNNSKVYLPSSVADAVNGTNYTVELLADSTEYSGNTRAYSPLMTVDETSDSFSIFVRTVGKTMELKQGANSLRLRTDFANVLDTTSAIVFDKGNNSVWYANAEAKSSFVSSNQAAAKNIILGGRLRNNNGTFDNGYITQAKYYAVRVYNRSLTQSELKQNAQLDRARYYGEEFTAPKITFNSVPLSNTGTTEFTASFVNGVATVNANSAELGDTNLTFSVNGTDADATVTTVSAIDDAVSKINKEVTINNVPQSATTAQIQQLIADDITSQLSSTVFVASNGKVEVTGTKNPYTATLSLGDDTKAVEINATINYSTATDEDLLKKELQKIMQGEFNFDNNAKVTAEALQTQIQNKIDETVTANVVRDSSDSYYVVTLSKNSSTLSYPLLVNSNFTVNEITDEMLSLCTTRTNESTTIKTENSVLKIGSTQSMTYENVVLPVFNFNREYMVQTDIKVTGAVNNSRWCALSYGVKSNPQAGANQWTFWQMAVRQNATADNGVECATMTPAAGWSVPYKGPYTSALDTSKNYTLTVVVKSDYVYEYINNQLIVKAPFDEAMKNGKVAFTWDRENVEYSNFTVSGNIPDSLPTDYPQTENNYNTNVYEPTTDLIMSPTVVSNSSTSAEKIASDAKRPATVLRTLEKDLTVKDGNAVLTLEQFKTALNKQALIGLRIEDADTAKAFAEYAVSSNLEDITIVSTNGEILKTACAGKAGIHGALDLSQNSELTSDNLLDVVSLTNKSNSRIAIIPASLATADNIAYIQARAVTTWVMTDSSNIYNAILNGADGIVNSDYQNVLSKIESFNNGTPVKTRKTFIVAHRGLHMTAPENSERSAILAVQAGADAIECDVHLTSDGEVVINHDETTGRLMNQNLTVANSTLEQLQSLTFNSNAVEGDKIPTLKELFEAADSADPTKSIIHVIEIKSSDPNLIKPMAKIIRECNMQDRVVFISFVDAQTKLIREEMPEISVGELNSCATSSSDVSGNLASLCNRLDPLNAFYNCSYGAQSQELVLAARHRGIYIHPWTVDDQSVYENEYFGGYHGITTNRADYATNYLDTVTTDNTAYISGNTAGSGAVITATANYRTNTNSKIDAPVFKQLDGNITVKFDSQSGTFYADNAGTATIAVGTTYTLSKTNKTYTVYSSPITITVNDKKIYGDANGDGKVTISDATKIQQSLAELATLTDKTLADVNGDGNVTIVDITTIQKYLAGYKNTGLTGTEKI